MGDPQFEEWLELGQDYKKLDEVNAQYLRKLTEISNLQESCLKHIAHQRYRMRVIANGLKKRESNDKVIGMKEGMLKREAELQEIEKSLPRKGEPYLKLVLGRLDVSFLNKDDKFKYKDEYEKFKLVNNIAAFIISLFLLYIDSRVLEQLYIGLLIWYYCTVSIRESVLRVNGSRIRGWWRIHHILSTISSGILLVWSDDETWMNFRYQFIYYSLYSCFIQYLQFKYQQGTLYRLKALGDAQNMDVTIEGFQSWMWRELSILLPFLFIGYVFQLANAFVLFRLSYHPRATWKVLATAILFFVLFVGNTVTAIRVVPSKTKQEMMLKYRVMTQRIYNAVRTSDTDKKGR
ncbi:unnamed protein product [Phaedon cochleariae]|uniref:Transmembrane protein 120 homolog n=1 Tax=Phaedon cochleariae TaxID=80249 RepID=A0A9P0DHN1_PHACE|nr:unnamed protein product [Phaedon cochleariae]